MTRFVAAVEAASGSVLRLSDESALPDALAEIEKDAGETLRALDAQAASPHKDLDPHDLARLDLTVNRGRFGVAENGAIWVSDDDLPHPAALFLVPHLVLVVRSTDIVSDMHEACARLRSEGCRGFGVFISGPSKTADIEQILVIGAHGPCSLTVILAGEV